MKRYLVILLLFTSCSHKFVVNGVEIKQRVKPISQSERPYYIASFLFGTVLVSTFVKK